MKRFKEQRRRRQPHLERVQGLGDAVQPEEQPAKPKPEPEAKGGAKAPKGAPAKAKATKKATAAMKAPKAKRAANAQDSAGPRTSLTNLFNEVAPCPPATAFSRPGQGFYRLGEQLLDLISQRQPR